MNNCGVPKLLGIYEIFGTLTIAFIYYYFVINEMKRKMDPSYLQEEQKS